MLVGVNWIPLWRWRKRTKANFSEDNQSKCRRNYWYCLQKPYGVEAGIVVAHASNKLDGTNKKPPFGFFQSKQDLTEALRPEIRHAPSGRVTLWGLPRPAGSVRCTFAFSPGACAPWVKNRSEAQRASSGWWAVKASKQHAKEPIYKDPLKPALIVIHLSEDSTASDQKHDYTTRQRHHSHHIHGGSKGII